MKFYGVRIVLLVSLFLFTATSMANCLDGLTTSSIIHAKINVFYINQDKAGTTKHYVILKKNGCTASTTGNITLAPLTLSHYYLSFESKDKTIYASLLSAQARDITVEFRLAPPVDGQSNRIAYIIAPSGARSQ